MWACSRSFLNTIQAVPKSFGIGNPEQNAITTGMPKMGYNNNYFYYFEFFLYLRLFSNKEINLIFSFVLKILEEVKKI